MKRQLIDKPYWQIELFRNSQHFPSRIADNFSRNKIGDRDLFKAGGGGCPPVGR
jgi:hypothetical protein